MDVKKFALGALSYPVVVFPLAYVWHLVVLEDTYRAVGYFDREEPIVALGFLAIIVQGLLLSYIYPFLSSGQSAVRDGLRFGLISGLFLWTCQVVATAAKHEVAPLSTFVALESGYLAVQFALVGLVLGVVYRSAPVPAA